MTFQLLGATLASTLAFLSGLHLYWAFGGRWGWEAAVPQVDGTRAFTPSRTATLVVALGLAAMAVVPLVRTGLLPVSTPTWVTQGSTLLIAAIFLLRAIGDFRLVGFFKRVRGTAFAHWDSRLFSPLCLLLAIAFAWIAGS